MRRSASVSGALAWIVLLPSLLLSQSVMQPILTNGPTARRINIVYLSEGYTAAQLPRFLSDASKTLDAFFNTSPFHIYRPAFNAYAISVASADSGSDHPSRGEYHRTFFNSTYDTYGITRLVTLDNVGTKRVDSLLALHMPEYDIAIVIVNDPEYGGSGGFPAVSSVHSASSEVVIHELGHSFAGLGDEYWDPYPGYPDIEEPNTTRETARAKIKWRDWIDPSTPVPTPNVSQYQMLVGLFEGAHYHATGWYRPMFSCKMRVLGAEFCPVCAETIVKSIYSLIRIVEWMDPGPEPVALSGGDTRLFRVTALDRSLRSLRYQWYMDGVEQSGETFDSIRVSAAGLSAGAHRLHVIVRDETPLVRTDPIWLLRDSISWSLAVTPATGVERENGTPFVFALSQNYPNPFNPSTTIRFSLKEESAVRLEVYTAFGQRVRFLNLGRRQAGDGSIVLNMSQFGSGTYFYRIEAAGASGSRYAAVKAMTFIK
ncbi:MAG: M64 family metallopeptidase [Acidobacteriota bacterium]